jgi:hypothetical protein
LHSIAVIWAFENGSRGFCRHAGHGASDHRRQRGRLCRCIARLPIANERPRRHRAGQVVLQLKRAYHNGMTYFVMSPLEFMQRLAALVPRPRLHLMRFHGVLAPNARLRAQIVPGPAQYPSEHLAEHAHGAAARMSWARLLKRVFAIDVEHCPHCGGALKIVAAVEESAVIARILILPTNGGPRD